MNPSQRHFVNFINLVTHYQFLTFTSASSFFVHKFIHDHKLLPEVFIQSNFSLLVKKFTVIIRELKISYTFTTSGLRSDVVSSTVHH